MKRKKDVIIRKATISDIDGMVMLEKKIWGGEGADEEKIKARIRTFPSGNLIALYDNNVVGYTSFQYVNDVVNGPAFTWSEITDNGRTEKSHKPNGPFSYGINLSVHPSMNGLKVAEGLILHGLADMIRNNKKGGLIGSRIPGFAKYHKHHPDIKIEEYIALRRHNNKLRDPELAIYEDDGFAPIKILPEYFPDPASLNYGILVYHKNTFYNLPFKRLMAWLIVKVGPKLIKGKKEIL